jgi:hypothetical protein
VNKVGFSPPFLAVDCLFPPTVDGLFPPTVAGLFPPTVALFFTLPPAVDGLLIEELTSDFFFKTSI